MDNNAQTNRVYQSDDSSTKNREESTLTLDTLHDIIRTLKSLSPVEEDNEELIKLAKAGDQRSRDLIVEKNYGLVLRVIFSMPYLPKLYDRVDLFEEGIIALIQAIDNYDESRATFSTHAINTIRSRIQREIDLHEGDLKQSVRFSEKQRAYRKLISSNPNITKEEVCRILKITEKTYQLLLRRNISTVSLNGPISTEEDDVTFLDLIASSENIYSETLNRESDLEMVLYFKRRFSALEYFIFYYIYLVKDRHKLEEIAQKFSVSREAIRQKQEKLLKKARNHYDDHGNRKDGFRLTDDDKRNMYSLTTSPINPDRIIIYLYIRDALSDLEKRVYKSMIYSKWKHDTDEFLIDLGLTYEEFNEVKESIEKKERILIERDFEAFKRFQNFIIGEYKTSIFKVNLEMDVSKYRIQQEMKPPKKL